MKDVLNFDASGVMKPMMVQTFTFDFGDGVGVPVRAAMRADGVQVLVAKDIVEGVGVKWDGSGSVEHVPAEWRGVGSVPTPSGTQKMVLLSEEGMNFYLFRSDKPRALPFQKWLAGDVLKQISATGHYEAPAVPANPLDVLQGMIDQMRAHNARLDRVEGAQTALVASLPEMVSRSQERAPVAEKPAGTESLSKLKARWNRDTGLPEWVIEQVLRQLKDYRIAPCAIVGRGERHDSAGDTVRRSDGSLLLGESYPVYQVGVVTRVIQRFLRECVRHPTAYTRATHPAMPGVSFKLNAEYGKRAEALPDAREAAECAADHR